MLCNNSRLNPPTQEQPHWTYLGDQTEAALLVLAMKGGLVHEAGAGRTYPRTHELPFDARRKRMSTIHRCGWRPRWPLSKARPREVLQLCTPHSEGWAGCPLDERTRSEILAANDDYARQALRVLALAQRQLPPAHAAFTPRKRRDRPDLPGPGGDDGPTPAGGRRGHGGLPLGRHPPGDDHRRLRPDGRIDRPPHRHAHPAPRPHPDRRRAG